MRLSKVINENDCQVENVDNETKTIKFFSDKGLCDQLFKQIMSMPPDIRTQFDYTIAVQSAGVKIQNSGMNDIEVTPFKVLLEISPKTY